MNSFGRKRPRAAAGLAIPLLFITLLGCDDPSSPADDGGPPPMGDGGSAEPDDSLFAICGAIFSPDGPSGYLALVPSLDATTSVDVENTIVFPGGAACAAVERSGTIFVGLAESPVIQRWEIDDEGNPSLTGQVSLAGEGFASAFRSRNPIQILSDSKAYFVSNEGVVVWNPSEMVIEGSFPLAGLNAPDLTTALSFPLRDGDRLVIPAWYRRADRSLAPRTQFAFIDVNTDEVTYSPVDTRCSVDWPAVADNGDMYFASPADQGINAAFGFAGDPAAPPCVVRLPAGATALDPAFFLDPQELVEPNYAGALADGVEALAFTLGYDESIRPLDESTALEAIGVPAWRYYGFSLAEPAGGATLVDALPAGAGLPWFNTADGVPYVFNVNAETGRATLFDISDPRAAQAAANVPGLPLQAIRVM